MKSRFLFRALAAIIAVIAVFSASACSPLASEETVLEEFRRLYERSLVVNEYIWGDGLPAKEYGSAGNIPYYVEVSEESPYRTRDELTAAVCEVYGDSYVSGSLKAYLFDGYGSNTVFSRYSADVNGYLSVDVKFCEEDTSGRFLTETARADVYSDHAIITCDYERSDMGVKTFTLKMVLQHNGWRFDQTTR